MAELKDREHFIPLLSSEMVEMLCNEQGPLAEQRLSVQDQQAFRHIAELMRSHYHNEYHLQLEQLKADYVPFDPDSDLRVLHPPSPAQRTERQNGLFESFIKILERANYVRMSKADIEKAMEGASYWGIDMSVEWDCFERVELFYRGQHVGRRTKRHWLKFWQKIDVPVPTYQRIVLILKLKQHKRLGPNADVDHVFVKLFKDIPTMDLEMILPGTRIRMRLLDRGKLGGSVLFSIAYVIFKLSTLSLGAITAALSGAITAAALALYGPIALVLGYAYKTWAGFESTRQTYMYQLTQSLYYQNLDNNAGVLFRLMDEAEEQESREAILAYFFLWRYAGDAGWTAQDLDTYIEIDLEKRANVKVDFEISDALDKLEHLTLVEKVDGGRYRALPIDKAIERLQEIHARFWAPKAPPPALVAPPAAG